MLYKARTLTPMDDAEYDGMFTLLSIEDLGDADGIDPKIAETLKPRPDDVRRIGQAKFYDGSTMVVTLRSDSKKYFIRKTLHSIGGTDYVQEDDGMFIHANDEYGPFVDFVMELHEGRDLYTPGIEATYSMRMNVRPDTEWEMIAVAPGRPVPSFTSRDPFELQLFRGKKKDMPQMTVAETGDALTAALRKRFGGNLDEIGSVLLAIDSIVVKAYRDGRCDAYLQYVRNDDVDFVKGCCRHAFEKIDGSMTWSGVRMYFDDSAQAPRDIGEAQEDGQPQADDGKDGEDS